jgi:hypothetical protein
MHICPLTPLSDHDTPYKRVDMRQALKSKHDTGTLWPIGSKVCQAHQAKMYMGGSTNYICMAHANALPRHLSLNYQHTEKVGLKTSPSWVTIVIKLNNEVDF